MASPMRSTAIAYAARRSETLWVWRPAQTRRERVMHRVVEAVRGDAVEPGDALTVLSPLEVGRRDAAGVGQDVGDDDDPALVEDGVRFRGRSGRWRPRR